jgi:ATP-binding cassette subfamily A (ABC1) protein 3
VVSGVGPAAYWLSNFVWDYINYLVPCLAVLVVFDAFQTEAYASDGRLGIVFLVFVLYGWAVLPFVYLWHFLFKTPAQGMVVVTMLNILTGT